MGGPAWLGLPRLAASAAPQPRPDGSTQRRRGQRRRPLAAHGPLSTVQQPTRNRERITPSQGVGGGAEAAPRPSVRRTAATGRSCDARTVPLAGHQCDGCADGPRALVAIRSDLDGLAWGPQPRYTGKRRVAQDAAVEGCWRVSVRKRRRPDTRSDRQNSRPLSGRFERRARATSVGSTSFRAGDPSGIRVRAGSAPLGRAGLVDAGLRAVEPRLADGGQLLAALPELH